MKRQELFDKVVTHLLTQKEQSRKISSLCAYRGQNNLKCAIGCLIPDDLYSESLEGNNVESLFVYFPKVRKLIGKRNKDLCENLQDIHDNIDVSLWYSYLSNLAESQNLNKKVLENFKSEKY